MVRYQPAFRFKSYICVCNQIGSMNENVLTKLKILAESAKYDVSCASSGTVRSNKPGMLGNTVGGWGICHSFAEDGRCISLLKVMLTNYVFTTVPTVSTGAVMICLAPRYPSPN